MIRINNNFNRLSESYLFSTIGRRVREFEESNPNVRIIKMGIGDVTLPLCSAAVHELVIASQEQGSITSFCGYGPEQGHQFLIEAIIENDYLPRGIKLHNNEVFISDGAKSDIGNIGDILSVDNVVAVTDPVYPVYYDTNVMAGRRIIKLPCLETDNFIPHLPKEIPNIIYLCYPNNPTGIAMTRDQLAVWVDFARQNKSLILFDSAYEAYITSNDVPHSIYEIDGARECAIEFRSFSKTAGFTGLRCGYTIVPLELKAIDADGHMASLNALWRRRQTTKFNGASYVVQRAATAVLSGKGRQQVRQCIDYYMHNAEILRRGLAEVGLSSYGGIDSPYLWVKAPGGMSSWEFFDRLLTDCHVVGTPGVGFGDAGEGFLRLTAFNSCENTLEAVNRLKSFSI